MKVCSQCGTANNDSAKFCKGCGNNVESAQPVAQPVQPVSHSANGSTNAAAACSYGSAYVCKFSAGSAVCVSTGSTAANSANATCVPAASSANVCSAESANDSPNSTGSTDDAAGSSNARCSSLYSANESD